MALQPDTPAMTFRCKKKKEKQRNLFFFKTRVVQHHRHSFSILTSHHGCIAADACAVDANNARLLGERIETVKAMETAAQRLCNGASQRFAVKIVIALGAKLCSAQDCGGAIDELVWRVG